MIKYKNKDYYYITYSSPGFVRLNPKYKVGVNIFILQYDGKTFYVKKAIDAINKKEYIGLNFFPNTTVCVLGCDKKDVIGQIFKKDWYGHE